MAYAIKRGKKMSVVMDSTPGPWFDELGSPVFSPSGRHWAYVANHGKRSFVMFNGERGRDYDMIPTTGGAPVRFAKDESLYYLAGSNAGGELTIFRVEERMRRAPTGLKL